MRRKPDTYEEPIIMEFPGMIARVYKPILTPEERERRMKEVHKAALALILSQERAKQQAKEAAAAE